MMMMMMMMMMMRVKVWLIITATSVQSHLTIAVKSRGQVQGRFHFMNFFRILTFDLSIFHTLLCLSIFPSAHRSGLFVSSNERSVSAGLLRGMEGGGLEEAGM